MALFNTPSLLDIIWRKETFPEDSSGIGGFMSGLSGAMGGFAGLGGGAKSPAPKGTTTVGGPGGKSYAPGVSGYGGPTGGTPGSGTVQGGGSAGMGAAIDDFINNLLKGLR